MRVFILNVFMTDVYNIFVYNLYLPQKLVETFNESIFDNQNVTAHVQKLCRLL